MYIKTLMAINLNINQTLILFMADGMFISNHSH